MRYLILLIQLVPIFLFAQNTSSNSSFILSVTGGLAIPVSGMEKFAEPGPGLSLNATNFFTKNFGLQGRLYAMSNKSFIPVYDELNPEGPYSLESINTSEQSNAGTWKTGGILFGPVIRITDAKMTLTFRAMSGYQMVVCPSANKSTDGYSSSNETTAFHSIQSTPEMKGYCVPLNLGYSVAYSICKKYELSLDLDYLTSIARFSGNSNYKIDTSLPDTHVEEMIPVSYAKNVSAMIISLGIGYRFQ
jgi:hypothetical protein